MKEKTTTKKVVKQYTFRQRKHCNGANTITNVDFDSPDEDGIAIARLLRSLPYGHIITVTVEKEESP